MNTPNTKIRRIAALLGLPLALWSTPASAYCTYTYNPWGPLCDYEGDEEACFSSELDDLSYVFHAIPVWVNTGGATFTVEHPNAQCDEEFEDLQVHRSVAMSGVEPEAFIKSVEAAIGVWNSAATAGPTLFYAGEVSGDTALAANRKIGITIDSYDCWSRSIINPDELVAARASAPVPGRLGDFVDPGVYRARIGIVPFFHGLQPADALVETCEELDPSLQPRPRVVCDPEDDLCDPGAFDCTAEPYPFRSLLHSSERGGDAVPDLIGLLVHEFGHTLGLNHNFFPLAKAPEDCGHGSQILENNVFGAMSYAMKKQHSNLFRDDIEGLTALYRTRLPLAWPVFHAQRLDELPAGIGDELGLLALPLASAPVRVSTGGTGDARTTALAYPDENRAVQVFTFTDGVLDPLALTLNRVDPTDTGITYDPVAIAYAPPDGMVDGTLLVAWNVESTDSPRVSLNWATRETSDTAWTVHGPTVISVGKIGAKGQNSGEEHEDGPLFPRVTDELGLAYDAVHDDFVLTLASTRYSVAVGSINRDGTLGKTVRELTGDPGTPSPDDDLPVASTNVFGTPACLADAGPTSRCILPVSSSGVHPEGPLVTSAGVVRFTRTTPIAVTGVAQELLANHSTCVDPNCPDFTAVGGATIAWNEDAQTGWVGYLGPIGDMLWHEFTRDMSGVPEFTDLAWDMPGNGERLSGVLGQPADAQILTFQSGWPVAPRRPATVGVSSDGAVIEVDVLRQHRGPPACGDGFVDAPPFGNEECDSGLSGYTCAALGFASGELACTNACTFDTSGCSSCGDGVATGADACDGEDLLGEDCVSRGFLAGQLGCTEACVFDTSACLNCVPGDPACICLDAAVDGDPMEGPLPGDGSLGDGHYCNDDVVFGGWTRCVQDGKNFTCQDCQAGDGVFCPCDPLDDCLDGQCVFACDSSPCTTSGSALLTGNCFMPGELPQDGGMPDWYFDNYCSLYSPGHVCNWNAVDGAVCVPSNQDDNSTCTF